MILAQAHATAAGSDLEETAGPAGESASAACQLREPATEDSGHGPTKVLIQAQFILPQREQDSPNEQLKSLIDDLNLIANSPDRQCDLRIAVEACPSPPMALAAGSQSPEASSGADPTSA